MKLSTLHADKKGIKSLKKKREYMKKNPQKKKKKKKECPSDR